jgi:cation diffusion facilitator CzcD-associated flavoprotein CzcO
MATQEVLEADYLIIGAGAMAMAFADTLLAESDHSAVMVDRRHKPGGHWNESYPFVRLHGPSANYGVTSRPLRSTRIDHSGSTDRLLELATGSEICT